MSQRTVDRRLHTLPSVLYTDQQGVGGGNGERGRTCRGAGGRGVPLKHMTGQENLFNRL